MTVPALIGLPLLRWKMSTSGKKFSGTPANPGVPMADSTETILVPSASVRLETLLPLEPETKSSEVPATPSGPVL